MVNKPYLLSINNIPSDASLEDIINFGSYVDKYNKAIIANLLNTKRSSCCTIPKLEIVESQVKPQPESNANVFDINQYLEY